MRPRQKTWLATLCLGMALLFCAQVMVCFADDTGVWGCCKAAAQHDRDDSTAGGNSHDASHASHCCHSHVHSAMLTAESPLIAGRVPSGLVFGFSDSPSEGPVPEIDLPPQLS
ncbi:MAG TPA: hypothetical protein VIT91_15495 [Chthoniobacterales bacterium]